jgi:hypothetical protein
MADVEAKKSSSNEEIITVTVNKQVNAHAHTYIVYTPHTIHVCVYR